MYLKFLKYNFLEKLRLDEPSRTLMHDNLPLHKLDLVYFLLEKVGHAVIFRPPDQPYIAPIEYVFNMIVCKNVLLHGSNML